MIPSAPSITTAAPQQSERFSAATGTQKNTIALAGHVAQDHTANVVFSFGFGQYIIFRQEETLTSWPGY
jgi:D-alanyl-D-alanine carboxypeptidase